MKILVAVLFCAVAIGCDQLERKNDSNKDTLEDTTSAGALIYTASGEDNQMPFTRIIASKSSCQVCPT